MSDPVSWLVVSRRWKVVDATGKPLGRVREVMGDPEADIFNGLLIERGRVGGSEYVPAEQVAEIREGEVHLAR